MMKIKDCRVFIRAFLLTLFFLPLLFSPALAGGFCEEGYPLPELYTDQVREEGRIDRLDGEELVINDMQNRLLPSTRYYNHVMRPGSLNLFHEGDIVGYIVNQDREVLSLWPMKDPAGGR